MILALMSSSLGFFFLAGFPPLWPVFCFFFAPNPVCGVQKRTIRNYVRQEDDTGDGGKRRAALDKAWDDLDVLSQALS